MRTVFDQLYKDILSGLLQPVTRMEVGREIPGHVLVADVWVEPVAEHAGALESLGVLGRMIAQGPCLVEPFSGVPGMREVRSCVLEQYALDHAQYREARRESRAEPPFPLQWVISVGRPETVLRTMKFRPMEGWPRGFWQREDCDALHVVVVRDLPRTPDTLYLRLLSRDRPFHEAVKELAALDDERAIRLREVFLVFKREIRQDPNVEEDAMEAVRSIEEAYAEWEREVMDKGRRDGLIEGRIEGHREGRIEAIETACSLLDIELTEERRQTLASLDLEQLESLLTELKATRRWPGE